MAVVLIIEDEPGVQMTLEDAPEVGRIRNRYPERRYFRTRGSGGQISTTSFFWM